ncbi:helix-turn-helix domain-containing protein [Corynebacterium epidermidicanis]|uniref:helix-turn-helix domain-containing protein n=1 Tax=Corynebacterium epidermidicanis TaxID=1050174 RepID=UPI000640F1EA|nr:helix-turn-helix transcriptional regulator [Corynebacterium epidermidicanis]
MATQTALLEKPGYLRVPAHGVVRQPEPLLREALGAALRAFRADRGVTLRELAEASSVSPGYLSELERGRKEVSSELLASVCHALGASVSDVLIEAAGSMAMRDANPDLATI